MSKLCVVFLWAAVLLGGCATPSFSDCQAWGVGVGYIGTCPKPLSLRSEKVVCLKLKEIQIDRRKNPRVNLDSMAFENLSLGEGDHFVDGASARAHPDYYQTGKGYELTQRTFESEGGGYQLDYVMPPQGIDSPELLKPCPRPEPGPQTAHR